MRISPVSTITALVLATTGSACSAITEEDTTSGCFASVTTQQSGAELGVGSMALGNDELAQSFVVTAASSLTSVKLKLKRLGQPNGVLTLSVQKSSGTGSSSLPSGEELSNATFTVTTTSATESTISTTEEAITFTLSSAVSLSVDTVYWLRLKASYSLSDTNLIQWMANSGDVYSKGFGLMETSTSNLFIPAGTGKDFLFQICGSSP